MGDSPADDSSGNAERPLTPDQMNEDLEFVLQTIEEVRVNMYAFIEREAFDACVREARAELDRPLTRIDFYKIVGPLVARLRDGHTTIGPWLLSEEVWRQKNIFPVPVMVQDGKAYVHRESRLQGVAPGAEIMSINGVSMADFIPRASRYLAQEQPHRPPALSDFETLYWLEHGFSDVYEVEIRSAKGGRCKRLDPRDGRRGYVCGHAARYRRHRPGRRRQT